MTIPAVNQTEIDGALGIIPQTSGRPMSIAGCSSIGTVATPASYARVSDIKTAFGVGPLVEAACHAVEKYGKPVILCKSTSTTAGSYGTIDVTGVTGTSVATNDTVALPYDDADVVIVITTGGTKGTTGIYYKYSVDNGNSYSQIQSLGTAAFILISELNSKTLLGAGTLVAGDTIRVRCNAPTSSATDLGTALDALKVTTLSWGICQITAPLDATLYAAIETKFAAMAAVGRPRLWIANTRMPTSGESESAYATSLSGTYSTLSGTYGAICAGACRMTSSVVSGRKYRRPISMLVAARQSNVTEEINIADVNLGAFTGVSIRDSNGNVDQHDEAVNGGLDDLRMVTFRTYNEVQGVYVTRPLMFTAAGSDFDIVPKRLVMNTAEEVLRSFFIRRLNAPIIVSKTTGYIRESEALEIEAGANAALRGALGAKPMASSWAVTISRTDNILSTKTMTVTARVVPLAYPEQINLEFGFTNPVNQVLAA